MQRRPSLIILPLSLLLAAGLPGCGDGSDGEKDSVAKINADYASVLRERPIIRDTRGTTDESAEALRRIATRADTIGRTEDARAAANLAANIRSAAGAFEFDEAVRLESAAHALRTAIRSLASDAELLDSAAMAAESMDTSAANLVIESNLADARSRIAAAEDQLDELNDRIGQAAGQRDSRISRATALEATAGERGRTGVDAGPLDGLDDINASIDLRQEARGHRIAAARDHISVHTLTPTVRVAEARRNGQNDILESARSARDNAAARRDAAVNYASGVRSDLDQLAQTISKSLAELNELEDMGILPRFEASMRDFDSAVNSARQLKNGGTKSESASGARAIANAEFGKGRVAWEAATMQNRRADVIARVAASGVISDTAGLKTMLESTIASRDAFLLKAETAMQKGLEALNGLQARDATDAKIVQQIQRAIEGVKGGDLVSMSDAARTDRAANRSAASTSGRGSSGSGGGSGFATPAAIAKFLSSPSTASDAADRLNAALVAKSETAQQLKKMFTAQGDLMNGLITAMNAKFGQDATASAITSAEGMADGPLSSTFTVASVDGDTGTLSADDGQKIVVSKTSNGWVVDLDATLKADPEIEMMVAMAGPMIERMMSAMSKTIDAVTDQVNAGDFDSANAVMSDLQEKLAQSMMGGMGGGGQRR
ncbi:MAG: hypothetical protein P8J59_12450 [Phycisphaerales bacterium]|nr:hypothetical protein [Phycisphaerales bacterium]